MNQNLSNIQPLTVINGYTDLAVWYCNNFQYNLNYDFYNTIGNHEYIKIILIIADAMMNQNKFPINIENITTIAQTQHQLFTTKIGQYINLIHTQNWNQLLNDVIMETKKSINPNFHFFHTPNLIRELSVLANLIPTLNCNTNEYPIMITMFIIIIGLITCNSPAMGFNITGLNYRFVVNLDGFNNSGACVYFSSLLYINTINDNILKNFIKLEYTKLFRKLNTSGNQDIIHLANIAVNIINKIKIPLMFIMNIVLVLLNQNYYNIYQGLRNNIGYDFITNTIVFHRIKPQFINNPYPKFNASVRLFQMEHFPKSILHNMLLKTFTYSDTQDIANGIRNPNKLKIHIGKINDDFIYNTSFTIKIVFKANISGQTIESSHTVVLYNLGFNCYALLDPNFSQDEYNNFRQNLRNQNNVFMFSFVDIVTNGNIEWKILYDGNFLNKIELVMKRNFKNAGLTGYVTGFNLQGGVTEILSIDNTFKTNYLDSDFYEIVNYSCGSLQNLVLKRYIFEQTADNYYSIFDFDSEVKRSLNCNEFLSKIISSNRFSSNGFDIILCDIGNTHFLYLGDNMFIDIFNHDVYYIFSFNQTKNVTQNDINNIYINISRHTFNERSFFSLRDSTINIILEQIQQYNLNERPKFLRYTQYNGNSMQFDNINSAIYSPYNNYNSTYDSQSEDYSDYSDLSDVSYELTPQSSFYQQGGMKQINGLYILLLIIVVIICIVLIIRYHKYKSELMNTKNK